MASALQLVNGVPRMVEIPSATIDVKSGGTTVVSGASAINFTNPLTAVDGGGGQADITDSTGVVYDETVTIGVGGIAANTNVSLPNSGTYEDKELKVFVGGLLWESGQDYDLVGTGSAKTQIEVLRAMSEGEIIRFRVEGISNVIYDEVVVAGSGGISAGANITLPLGRSYDEDELQVYLDGQYMEVLQDYNYVGAGPPRTQIQLVFDILEGERLRFRIES